MVSKYTQSLSVLAALALQASVVCAQPTAISRLFTASSSIVPNSTSAISGNGAFVAFAAGPASSGSGTSQVYRYNRSNSTSALISHVVGAATGGNQASYRPDISNDGRYVVFQSSASDLAAGDTNNDSDVFLWDANSDTVTKLSSLIANDYIISGPFISGDGSTVTWTEFIDSSGDYVTRVYSVTGLSSSVVTLVTNSDQVAGISLDGRYLLYYRGGSSGSSTISSLYRFDRNSSQSVAVDVSATGTVADKTASEAAISQDGRYVSFSSNATNLVADDTNKRYDIFRKDLESGAILRVSKSVDGVQSNSYCSSKPAMSSDGRYVAFSCIASNLVYGDSSGYEDIFVVDTTTGAINVQSQTTAGVFGNDDNLYPDITNDGSVVVFYSTATNLVSDDTNTFGDLFLATTGAPLTVDACPSDTTKLVAGTCGCGVSDADTNANGVADCNDGDGNTVPTTAATLKKLTASKVKITLPAAPEDGVRYRVTVKRGTSIVRQFTTSKLTTTLTVTGKIKVVYQYIFASGILSQESPSKSLSISRLKGKKRASK